MTKNAIFSKKKAMPKIGKKGKLIESIKAKTKLKNEDIYDILRVLPDCLAQAIMDRSLPEKKVLHLGFISVYWQSTVGNKPELVFLTTKSFKKRFAELKFEGKTPLAQTLYNQLPKNMKEKMKKNRLRNGSKASPVLPKER